jgi:rhamnogalacturonyl hydrolase YesR
MLKKWPTATCGDGHWYQLVTLPGDTGNFEESSCTAMFSYTIAMGLQMKLLDPKKYLPMIEHAYKGLRELSIKSAGDGWLVPARFRVAPAWATRNIILREK